MSPNLQQIAILRAVSREAERSGRAYCKCARVLALAAESLGFLDAESHRRLFTEGEDNAVAVEELYEVLIGLAASGDLLVGQGNLGGVDWAPANPLFTECCLTARGEALVGELG